MILDAHVHLWKYSPSKYAWITDELDILKKDYLPNDLERELNNAKIDGAIVVQATHSLDETLWLLELSNSLEHIKGVIGWVDLKSPYLEETITCFKKYNKFLGVRHIVQDEPDIKFLLAPDFIKGVSILKKYNLVYELVIRPEHLPYAVTFVETLQTNKIILDHACKPNIRFQDFSLWKKYISILAKYPSVYCKVSGLLTEASWNNWKFEDFDIVLDHLLKTFGQDRLVFGSDWPVCLLSGKYSDCITIAERLVKNDASLRNKVFSLNAKKFYGL